jgi:hypothetical protein
VTTPSAFDGTFTTVPVIPARSDGKMQWLRTRWEYPFEFSIHTKSANGIAQGQYLANYEDLAFAAEGNSTTSNSKLFSPHNIKTARYGITSRAPWPTLYHLGIANVKNTLNSDYATTYNRFKSGLCFLRTVTDSKTGISTTTCNYPYLGSNIVINPNGPNPYTMPTTFFAPVPWGVQYGGMTSGSEIHPGGKGFDVWAARSRKGALNLYLYMSSRLLRQEVLRKLNGELVSPMDAVVQGPNGAFVPVRAFGGYNTTYCPACDSLFGFNNAPTFQSTYVINNNLLPDYYNVIKGFMQEDEQHKVRTTNGLYAVLQLMAHPRSIDMTLAEGYYSYFANPNLPQYYSGTTPKYQPAHLASFRKVTPDTGTGVGRDFAHTQMARVMAYAVGDSAFRNFMFPYHQYVMREIMARSQMWHGKLINKAAFAKTSPTGNCQVAISREENFLILANMATRERVFRKMSPASSGLAKRVITKSTQSILNLDLVWPQNNWSSQFSNVMIAAAANPNQVFSNWSEVPAACKTDAFNGGPDAGEFHLTIATGAVLDNNAATWQALKSSLHKIKPTPTSTLGKLQALSHYDLSSTNNVANLGYCQIKEQQTPGYCG